MKITVIVFLHLFVYSLHAVSIGSDQTKWLKREVKVCWGQQAQSHLSLIHYTNSYNYTDSFDNLIDFRSDQKKMIQHLISSEFSLARTGITFIGWNDCTDNSEDYDVMIFRKDEPERSELAGQGMIGDGIVNVTFQTDESGMNRAVMSYHRNTTKLKPYVVINTGIHHLFDKISESDFLKLVSLHEFGHVAGLAHEHARVKEAKKDKNCKRFKVPLSEKLHEGFETYESYDHNSIMSYCFLYGVAKHTGLEFETNRFDKPLVLKDISIYSVSKGEQKRHRVKIKIGLSQKDIKTLKTMYP